MLRATKSIAFVLLSLGTAALAACGSNRPASMAAVPSWPSTASAPTSTTDTTAPASQQQSESAATSGTHPDSTTNRPGGAPSDNQRNGDQQDLQPGRVARCSPSALSGRLVGGSPGAGQRYASLVVTNVSRSKCTMYGYGGLQLLDSDGRALPTRLERTPNPGPRLVTLSPGKSASKELHWGAVPGPGDSDNGPCQATPARAIVIPPDDTSPFSVTWTFGPVCNTGRIEGSAYH